MIKAWVAIALLASGWLAMLGYYHQPDAWTGGLLLAGGLVLMGAALRSRRPTEATAATAETTFDAGPWEAGLGVLLLVPVVAVAPWPYKIAPILLLTGMAILTVGAFEHGRTRSRGGAAGVLLIGGAVLLGQMVALSGYEAFTARTHELPGVLAQGLAGLGRLVGIKTAVDGNNNIVLYTFRLPQRMAATWELLFDPATLAFLAGGLLLLAICGGGVGSASPPGPVRASAAPSPFAGVRRWFRAALVLSVCVGAWLPVRAVVLMAIYLQRVLRTDYDAPIDLMDQFWSTWVNLALLVPPALLAAAWIREPAARSREAVPADARTPARRWAAAVLSAVAVALLSAAIVWNPPGQRKAGRILVDEYHSKWEDTRRPFDTNWYGHESTYQFAAAFDYLSRFYHTGRIESPITERTLQDCDVLIVKVPTSPYESAEIRAVQEFVRRGGGLLLIGEHTNVFGTGEFINDLAERFGFTFRYDCLFGIDTVFFQAHRSPVVPHPILRYLPPRTDGRPQLDWVVSCSIDPGFSSGRAPIRSIGLKNLPADYYASNFYPQVHNHPYMRYGAFVQVWATDYGRGRVVGFTDSTQLSNFCVFEPGKIELQMGMLEWLNHSGGLGPRYPLLAAGAIALVLALTAGAGRRTALLRVLPAGLLGWAVAVVGVNAAHAATTRPIQPIRPMVRVVMDRTVSGGKLPMGGFISGEPDGFGIFEMWILRLGYFNSRRSGASAFDGDALIFAHPDKPVSEEFRAALGRYVEQGGRVLVIDSPGNVRSTAGQLLYPFGLSVAHEAPVAGLLTVPAGWPAVVSEGACQVRGGEPLVTIDNQPVAAVVRRGKGTVTVIGFGGTFSDQRMGVMADVVPSPELRQSFDLEYALLRAMIEDRLPTVQARP